MTDRTCYVCGGLIPTAAGVYHAGLDILTHAGACTETVRDYSRDYSHSERGRRRPRSETLRLLRADRAGESLGHGEFCVCAGCMRDAGLPCFRLRVLR